MSYTVSTIKSGLPVLSASAGTESVTVLVFAGAGSRYETEEERGISHFLEHMFFKGGKKYTSTKEVSAAIDGVGGEFNAFTGKEYAGYYVKVAADQVELACDVLSDMLLHATFPKEEIEKERGVIMEEERMYQDTPMYRVGWDFEELMFGSVPLGWDTIGTEKLIKGVQQADFQAHKDRLYTPDNTVVTFAGNIDHKKAEELTEKYFGELGGAKGREYEACTDFSDKRVYLRSKKTEQTHMVIGVPGVSSQHEDRFVQRMLGIILGGNMSSRMFLNIREAKGLCYYIDTDTDQYMDTGYLSTRAGVDQSRFEEAVSLILNEYAVCAKDGVTEEELSRAKAYLKGGLTLALEDTEERAHFFGKQKLLYPDVRDLPEYFAKIDAVTKDDVDRLAREILVSEKMKIAVIGDVKSEGDLEKLLES